MTKWIGIGLTIIAVLSIAFIAVLYIFPGFREATRDVAVVVVAFFMIVQTLITVGLLLAIVYGVRELKRVSRQTLIPRIEALTAKVDMIVDNARTVSDTARDTVAAVGTSTNYVAERVVSPLVRISALMAGVKAAASYVAKRD